MASLCLRLAILALALALSVKAQPNNTVGQGIISVQNGVFVDAACREFQFSGGNV